MSTLLKKRRTFAIISHPDAGKTTITEKVLLFGAAILRAGTVKGRGSNQHAKSDWMEMEKKRGISVTTSVMQFEYNDMIINLLDTPGHEDFSEDTYRTLTAVDSCLMVIDSAKGVEDRTKKLMEVVRPRNTPILTFMNKLDRDIRDPMELIDDIEKELNIICSPITWPIGCGKNFKGVYHLGTNEAILYQTGYGDIIQEKRIITDENVLQEEIGDILWEQLQEELELVKAVLPTFDLSAFLKGEMTPLFFGTALGNFGVDHMLDGLCQWAPSPQSRMTTEREILPTEDKMTGFIFKIQANMDPKHRDRIAFMRLCSGQYKKGMKLYHPRTQKTIIISDALTFMAGDRKHADTAYAGDIIGLHNHGTIQIGDTFTEGETLSFLGIPHFAPELFKKIRLANPLKQKQLLKGLLQLSEEGAVQVFRPLDSNEIIVGAVGVLQFDVVVERLRLEYKVDAIYESTNISLARWIHSDDQKKLDEFKRKMSPHLALDSGDCLMYLASSLANLNFVQERSEGIQFLTTKDLIYV